MKSLNFINKRTQEITKPDCQTKKGKRKKKEKKRERLLKDSY